MGLAPMPKKLKRRYGTTKLHFITFSCYRRLAFLRTVRARNAFLIVLNDLHAYESGEARACGGREIVGVE